MGNQMFQYATGRALALRHGVPLALDRTFLDHRITYPHFLRPHFVFRTYDLDVFNIKAEIAKPEDINWWNRPILRGKLMLGIDAVLRKIAIFPGWEKRYTFNERILSLGPNAYLAGFWQSEKYFIDAADTIRKDFMLKDPLAENIQALKEEIAHTAALCLHVRRSDIAKKSFYGEVGIEYYRKAIERIDAAQPVGTIYVFSDDIQWCKSNLSFPHPTVFVGPEYAGSKAEGHLALMSSCRHFIIPNSTFSWWAAWLGEHPDKIVVAPKKWYKSDSSDLVPEGWIRL